MDKNDSVNSNATFEELQEQISSLRQDIDLLKTDLIEDNTKFLPDPDGVMDFYDFDSRTMYLWEEITTETVLPIVRAINYFNREYISTKNDQPITLFINCYGGDAMATLSLVDAIQSSEVPVITYNMGACFSGAFYILIAGTNRIASRNSTCLIHDGDITIGNSLAKAENMFMFYSKTMASKFKQIVLDNTRISEELLDSHAKDEWFISADEALELGIVDTIDDEKRRW